MLSPLVSLGSWVPYIDRKTINFRYEPKVVMVRPSAARAAGTLYFAVTMAIVTVLHRRRTGLIFVQKLVMISLRSHLVALLYKGDETINGF